MQANLTIEGLEAIENELKHLTIERRREVASRIHDASEGGGRVDNAEYEEAKNEQAFIEGRIVDLERILSRAIVVTNKKKRSTSSSVVDFGSDVTVQSQSGSTKTYKIVGSVEANPLKGNISVESPVGSALMGCKIGEEVTVDTPSGTVILTINKIRYS